MLKIDEMILREVSKELLRLFPDDFSSITQVHVSKDLAFAKVWVSSVKDIDKKVERYQHHAKEIRKSLSQNVIARKVPSLYFVADKTEEKASHIDCLIEEVSKEKR